ncbi:MAG: hypothetical protein HC930_05105 [Hydrococcus sp. SU_1_0]|nr:hypothetical protein [Hydrococcus sp. SU_1_0]
MSIISANSNILKVEALQTKFDLSIVSNSLVNLIGNYLEARIVQQLHYWTVHEYGKVINGLRWIYKPVREWLSEALIGFTNWQLRTAIANLIEKGILLREHLFKEHHGNNFAPKNRTYYYSLNYKGLEKFAQKQKIAEAGLALAPVLKDTAAHNGDASFPAESTKNVRFVSSTNQFCDSSENQFCEKTKNITENTSIENISTYKSHPHLPCESEIKTQEEHQEKQDFSNLQVLQNKEVNSPNPKVIEEDTNVGQVEENINQNVCTDKQDVQESVQVEVAKPRLKTPKGTKPKSKRRNDAPWKDEGQFKRFYRALIQAVPIVANARSPQGLAQTIIRQLRSGIPHTYWDDFIAGVPIGTSTKPEWEVEPGVPYPMFIEYLTEKIIRGNNTQTQEQARNEVFRILDQPRQAKAFWGQFKRSVVNVSEQVERDRALGVSNPNTPVWSRERIEPSIEEAQKAGKKIMAANGTQTAMEAAKIPQLELEAKSFTSAPPASSTSSASPASPSPSDPWTNEPEPESKPQLTMREMLAARGIKGFVKSMPKVSQAEIEAEERAEIKPKTNIATMAIAEINDYLQDPILRAQLTPQLIDSDYELILDYLGQIIGVKLSDLQIREREAESLFE